MIDQEKTGLLFDTNDHQAMARCMMRLIDEPQFAAALARNARAEVEQYSWPPVFEKLARVYRLPEKA
jgi:glycosyltransferase involved in cell wall biosynthesis